MKKTNNILLTMFLLLLLPAISFSATITSQSSGDWYTGSNWVGGVSPVAGDDVIIKHAIDFTSSTISINSLQIINTDNAAAILDISGGSTMTIITNLTAQSTNAAYDVKLIIRSTAIVQVGGNVLFERTSDNVHSSILQLKMQNSGKLMATGAFDFHYRNSGSEIAWDIWMFDDAILSAGQPSSLTQEDGQYFNPFIYDQAQMSFPAGLDLSISGGKNLTLALGGTASLNVDNGLTLSNTGSTTGSFDGLFLTASATASIVVGTDLTMNSSAANLNTKIYLTSDGSSLDLNGDLNMNANSDDVIEIKMTNASTFNISGNVDRTSVNSNGYGSLSMANDSEIYFDGMDQQFIPEENIATAGTDAFNYTNLFLNNTSTDGVELTKDLTITGHMTLTDGKITTSSTALLIIDHEATIDLGSSVSYVDGPMIKRGSTGGVDFTFPVGNNGRYGPITIEAIPASKPTLEYTVQFIGCPPPIEAGVIAPIEVLITQGYWDISRNDGSSVGDLSLHWDNANDAGIADISVLVVGFYDYDDTTDDGKPIGWNSLGRSSSTGSIGPNSGSIKNDIGCPPPIEATRFAIGSTDSKAALPVELMSFNAFQSNDDTRVFLEWETASEENSEYFVIEKSYDGAEFHEVARVPAAQNSSSTQFYTGVDDEPAKGNNYYRIQMVDLDRTMNFSRLINIFMKDKQDAPVVYPNPVQDYLRVYSKSLSNQDEIFIKILDLSGRCIYTGNEHARDGQLYLSASNLNIEKPGIYFINYEDDGEVYSLKFMKLK